MLENFCFVFNNIIIYVLEDLPTYCKKLTVPPNCNLLNLMLIENHFQLHLLNFTYLNRNFNKLSHVKNYVARALGRNLRYFLEY